VGGIFINYRRHPERDWFVRTLRDRLADYFGEGQVFLDNSSIDVGEDYRSALRARLLDAEVVIAVIHREWVAELRADGLDWVREELELALEHQKKIIPLLLDGVPAPDPTTLPSSIHQVAYKQAHQVHDRSWNADIVALIHKLTPFVASTWEPGEPENVAPARPCGWVGFLVGALALGVFVAPVLFLPDDTAAREVAVIGSLWLLALMLPPLIATLAVFLVRKPVNVIEYNLHDMPLRAYYARVFAPFSVLLLLLSGSYVTAGGPPPEVIPFLISIVIFVTLYVVVILRKQRKDEEQRETQWPQRMPEPVRAAPARQELSRLQRRITGWPHHRATRELCDRADWHLRHLRSARLALGADARRGRWSWLMADHPVLLGCYAAWVGGAVGLLTAAALPRLVLWVPAIAAGYACAVAAATAEIAYRHQRWRRTRVADEIDGHADRIEQNLMTLRGRRG
jgi:hypothetical protein